MIRISRFKPHALLAIFAALALGVTPAKATPLSTLLGPNESFQVGDKVFSDFSYTVTGNMPTPDQVSVTPYTDAQGNFGIQVQGSFFNFTPGVGSNALLDYTVSVIDPSKQIVGSNLVGNPDVIGGNGFISVTGSFLPEVNNATSSIYDIVPGTQKLTDSTAFSQGFQTLHVQDSILAFSSTGVGTMSFLQQTFVQASGPVIPEPATVTLMSIGLVAVCFMGWRKRSV